MTPSPSRALIVVLALAALAACHPKAPTWIPLTTESTTPASDVTLVWVGRGECERFEDGRWIRRPEFDYEFSVEQRRRGSHWSSIKSMRRHHPAYDGSAGPRSLTYFFELDFARPDAGGRVAASLASSLGAGTGLTDREFRAAVIEIRADVSRFAPFDRYRISQSYQYEQGRLEELVELSDGDEPWVRNREVAMLFGPRNFEGPPTRR